MIFPHSQQIKIVMKFLVVAANDTKPVTDASENFIKKTGHFAAEFRKLIDA